MPRHLIVVSRREAQLYSYLLDRFRGDANVVVILDRRSGEDRRASAERKVTGVIERRRGPDRRASRDAQDELAVTGHVVVTREDHDRSASP